MNLTTLSPDIPTKTIVRQEADYEAAGLEGNFTVPLPFTTEHINEQAIINLGLSAPGIVRGMNTLFVENVGNLLGARVRAAVAKGLPLPTQEDFNALITAYDFSGVRASSESGMPAEERAFRTQLKQQLRALLRKGIFSADRSNLTVQTVKEAVEESLPNGKISISDFEELTEAAAEGLEYQFDGISFDFSGDPEFDEDGDFANFAAIPAFAADLARQEIALKKAATGRSIKASIPNE